MHLNIFNINSTQSFHYNVTSQSRIIDLLGLQILNLLEQQQVCLCCLCVYSQQIEDQCEFHTMRVRTFWESEDGSQFVHLQKAEGWELV